MSVQSEAPDAAIKPHSRRAPALDDEAATRALADPDLLALISRGDRCAFGVIYDRHIEAAWRIALHFSASTAAAEQAVTAVFLRLWRNPEPGNQTSLPARLLPSVWREAAIHKRFREENALRG